MIELKNVSKFYNNNGNVALGLRNVNLKLYKNEIVAIVGESGAGKSTLLNVICGVDTYEEGEILFKGNETSYFNQNDMDLFRKNNVAFIYQQYNLIDSYTVLENVMLPLLMNNYNFEDAKIRATELIEKVGLKDRISNKGINLSGGEKQRCVIARALASDCEILACDEPTGNLDSKTGRQIIDLIKEISKDKLVLIVTHNYEQIEDIVTRTIKVADGEIIEDYKKEKIDDNILGDMNLSIKSIDKKNLFRIAFQNLKNTPRKTIFSGIVMIIISFMFFFLLLSCFSYDDQRRFNLNENYKNGIHNRLLVFNADHSALDISDFEKIDAYMVQNPFYEDIVMRVDYDDSLNGEMNGNYVTLQGIFSSYIPQKYELVAGNIPTKEMDCLVLFPLEKLDDTVARMYNRVGRRLIINGLYSEELYISGYGYSSEVSEITFIPYGEELFRLLSDIYYNKLAVKVKVDDGEYKNINFSFGPEDSKPRLFVTGPKEVNVNELYFKLVDIYDYELKDYEIIYSNSKYESMFAYIPKHMVIEDVFEMSIYPHMDDVDDVMRYLKSCGYEVVRPGKSGPLDTIEAKLTFLIVVAICVVASIILAFIVYLIFLRIYASKKIDYTVMRSLGFIKRYLAKIVEIELLLFGVVSAIISIIVFAGLYLGGIEAFVIFKYNSVFISICYIIAMMLFSLLIARRFNKKLFKFSVGVSFKGDEVTND